MIHAITVSPVQTGWAVSLNQTEPRVFASGAQAETWARALAESLARRGQPTHIQITLRDGALAGRLFYSSSGWSAERQREPEPA
jgi:hypothetical protein